MKDESSKEVGVPVEVIERKIYLIRGRKVMLDRDMAALYRVPTKRLNEQVKVDPIVKTIFCLLFANVRRV